MRTIFSIIGLLVVLILTFLTGGLALLIVLLGSETMREALRIVIKDFVSESIYGDKESDK